MDEAKRGARDARKAEAKLRREQRWREIRCWWTRPMRHEFVELSANPEGAYEPMSPEEACVGCGRQK